MIPRVIVNGAQGRMGQVTAQTLANDAGFNLVAKTETEDDLGHVIRDQKADIVVDFTTASSGFDNACCIIENNARAVIGTSGFLPEHIDSIRTLCEKKTLGAVIAPNFSLGAVLLMKAAALIAPYFNDVELIEAHHAGKQDAPSGTALKTAEIISDAYDGEHTRHQSEKLLLEGVRGGYHRNIPIHSLRLSGLVAQQTVLFGGQGETLTLHHNSSDRSSFMPGVLLACRKVMQLDRLVYGLEPLLAGKNS